MSRKSKKEKQEALEAEKQAQAADAKITTKCAYKFRVMNNSYVVPVAKPADQIQLTPIVQPISLVPYSSQEQPMAEFSDDDDSDE